jgi:heme oxygenase
MDLQRLREETRADHEATEGVVPLMDPELTRAAYVEVLQRMQQVVSAWECWAARHAPARLATMVRERRRGRWIEEDLKLLGGRAAGPSEADVRELEKALSPVAAPSEAVFLGAMYVMEGSTLGGQYIARHVEATLGLGPGVGDAYFNGYGAETGSMWKGFKVVLAAVPDEQTAEVITAAKAMFRFFSERMRVREPGAAYASAAASTYV